MSRADLTTVVVLVLTLSSRASGLDAPSTVSPGGIDEFGRVDTTRPTFSWGAVGGTKLYELIVYSLPIHAEEPDADVSQADATHPVLRQLVHGTALSWTLSLTAPLTAPGRYGWSMRARKESGEISDWSEPRLFEVIPLASRLELEGVSWLSPHADARPDVASNLAPAAAARDADRAGRSTAPAGAALAGSAALHANQPDLAGSTYGAVGTAASPDGFGVAAANTAGGADLLLDGSADLETDTLLTQAGVDRPSPTAESFEIANSGGGDMTLVTDRLQSSGATDLAIGGALTTLHGSLSVLGDASITGTVDGVDVSAHAAAPSGVHGVGAGTIVGTTLDQTLTNKTFATPTIFNFTNAQHDHQGGNAGGVLDHGGLVGLSDDDHTQYARLQGRPGGQILWGGIQAFNNLSMDSTTSLTKGQVRVVNGSTFSVYSDGGATPVFTVIGSSGSILTSGTVDGVDVAFHDHSTAIAQTRLEARDRRRVAVWHKDDADASSGDGTSERVVFTAPENLTVTNVFISPASALTADDTDFATLVVSRRNSGGGGRVTVAAADTQTAASGGTGDWSELSTVSLGSLANTSIADGRALTFEITKASTGVVVPILALQIEYTVD